MSRKTKKGNYKVGYAKPPEHTRFKPGQSGNPSGRPKDTPNLVSVLKRALQAKIVLTEKGHRKTVTKLEAAMMGLANKSAAADLRALQLMVGLIRLGEEGSEFETDRSMPSSEADQGRQHDFIRGDTIPPVKGKEGGDGRPLDDILAEIYGIRNYAPRREPLAASSTGLDHGSVPYKDSDQG